MLIFRDFINFTKQFFTFHYYRVKCKKQILPSVRFEPKTFCIYSKRLTARPQGPHGRERTTLRLIFKYFKNNFLERHILHFTLLECNVKNCLVKLIKLLKLTETHYFVWNNDILLKNNVFAYLVHILKHFLHILIDFCAYLCAYLTKNSCIKFLSLVIRDSIYFINLFSLVIWFLIGRDRDYERHSCTSTFSIQKLPHEGDFT